METESAKQASCILYQTDSLDVFVIDVPASFTVAQDGSPGLGNSPYAAQAPIEVYPSTEPSQAKKNGDTEPISDERIQVISLLQALSQARAGCKGRWCLPRHVWDEEILGLKRGRDDALVRSLQSDSHSWSASSPLLLKSTETWFQNFRHVQDRLVCNSHLSHTILGVETSKARFLVPPSCHFLLSHINESTAPTFSMAALQIVPAGKFDFILLDPPWPNRSARRSRQYQIPDAADNPLQTLEPLISMHLAPGSFVACWVTNKAATRQAALDLFKAWNLVLCEQWSWLKVTARGQPVTSLDGVWRKPFEILLIACSKDSNHEVITDSAKVITRVLIAVPDLHSRKPSLKELIKLLIFPKREKYAALEVFARHLTADWFAWGNEVLKFNDIEAWCVTH